jgi:hypothetical protein
MIVLRHINKGILAIQPIGFCSTVPGETTRRGAGVLESKQCEMLLTTWATDSSMCMAASKASVDKENSFFLSRR